MSDRAKRLEAIRRAIPVTRMVDYGVPRTVAERVHRATSVSAGSPWEDVCAGLADDLEVGPHAGPDVVDWQAITALLQCAQLPLNDDAGRKHDLYHQARDAMTAYCAVTEDVREVVLHGDDGPMYGWEVSPTVQPVGGVLIVGGLTGWGSVYVNQARSLAAQGFHVVLGEGPGQGLTRLDTGIILSPKTFGRFTDFIDHLEDAAGPNIGVWGNSFGGLFAARIAIADRRVSALCVNGAPPKPVVPEFRTARESMYPVFGTTDDGELGTILAELTIDSSVDRVGAGVLVVEGGADPLVALGEQEPFLHLTEEARRSRMTWSDGEHTIYNHAPERNRRVAEWFTQELDKQRDVVGARSTKE